MKGREFLSSKWMRKAAEPGAEEKVDDKYKKWAKRVGHTGILARAKQLYQFFLSPEISGTKKLVVMAALLYIIAPLDLIPDVAPVVGWLDDIGVAGFALRYIFLQMDGLSASGDVSGTSDLSLDDEIEGTTMPYHPDSKGGRGEEER